MGLVLGRVCVEYVMRVANQLLRTAKGSNKDASASLLIHTDAQHKVQSENTQRPKGGFGRAASRRHPILDPIITMNTGGIIQSASDSVQEVFGWAPHELYGKNVKVLIPEAFRTALDRYLGGYRNPDTVESLLRVQRFAAVCKDGKMIQIELSMSRAELPAISEAFFIGIIRDVSQQMDTGPDTAEERIRLQRLITEQTRALATANLRLQLSDRLTSLGTLAAGLGHDMNNVLLPVRAHLNAIEHSGLNAEGSKHLSSVRKSIAYLQQLTDGLHFLALDPEGQGTTSDGKGTTNVSQWWNQVGGLLRKAVPKNVKVLASIPTGLRAIQIAPHWLTQAVLNLVVNAGEAIPSTRRNAVVRISAEMSDDDRLVRLSVTDNGRGMTQGTQKRALDLFFTTKPRSMGTGLGLPLARKVAIRAGGRIEIESTARVGTRVTMVMPIAPGQEDHAGVAGHAGHGSKNAQVVRTAAVTARNLRSTALIAQILTSANWHVIEDNDGAPSSADLWVTVPTTITLNAARNWRKGHPDRILVVLGNPSKPTRNTWIELGASIIETPDDFESLRFALAQVVKPLQVSTVSIEHQSNGTSVNRQKKIPRKAST